MMKPAPASPFKVIQAQVVLGALKVLFDVPTRAAQFQATRFGGRTMQVSEVVVIGLGVTRRPIDHQPSFFRFVSVLAQAMLQVDVAPSQAGALPSPVDRLPRTRPPLWGWEAGDDLRQGAGARGTPRRREPAGSVPAPTPAWCETRSPPALPPPLAAWRLRSNSAAGTVEPRWGPLPSPDGWHPPSVALV